MLGVLMPVAARRELNMKLELSISVVREGADLVAQFSFRNVSPDPIMVANPNIANLQVRHAEVPSAVVSSWFNSCGYPNIGKGTFRLEVNATSDFEVELLSELEFPQPGTYRAWVIYNTSNFKQRFSDVRSDEPMHFGLGQVDELRVHSEEVTFEISNDDVDRNREAIRKRWLEFLGSAIE